VLRGDGDLEAAAAQVCRFLSLDVDARGRPDVARRDPVIADAQRQLPGRKPEYLRADAEAALEGRLDGAGLRAADPDDALREHRTHEIVGRPGRRTV
jgi:3-methyladenine DNA glycosylase/8-oxoguanine DNA glycosylase